MSLTRAKPEPPLTAPCEAVAPDGRVCTKKKILTQERSGHRNKKHHVRGTPSSETWDGGRDGMPAIWTRDKPSAYSDPGDMSEGEWQAFGQYGWG